MFKWKKLPAGPVDLNLLARKLIHFRQLRSEFFAVEAIASGGWDLMLHLYSTPTDTAPITIASAARSLGVSSGLVMTTLERICHFGLATQGDSPGNWEDIQILLTPNSRAAMGDYLATFTETYPPIAD